MEQTSLKLDDFSIEAIAESGQCFRITPCGGCCAADDDSVKNDRGDGACGFDSEPGEYGHAYTVNALGRVLRVTEIGEGRFRFSCNKSEFEDVWKNYFDLGTDYQRYRDAVLPDDEYLKTAVTFGKGIRILNQDPWEMLVSFIISQRKSVPAIRTSIERLSRACGSVIHADGNVYYSFPAPESIVSAETSVLASCGLGYRVDYVREAAMAALDGRFNPEKLAELPTDGLIDELMSLKGVGIKVASCVALFGFHRLDAFPVDVWMKRVMDTVYGGSLPDVYRPYAGVLQQYMFNYARLKKCVTV